jgi:hypothetical protein
MFMAFSISYCTIVQTENSKDLFAYLDHTVVSVYPFAYTLASVVRSIICVLAAVINSHMVVLSTQTGHVVVISWIHIVPLMASLPSRLCYLNTILSLHCRSVSDSPVWFSSTFVTRPASLLWVCFHIEIRVLCSQWRICSTVRSVLDIPSTVCWCRDPVSLAVWLSRTFLVYSSVLQDPLVVAVLFSLMVRLVPSSSPVARLFCRTFQIVQLEYGDLVLWSLNTSDLSRNKTLVSNVT